MTPTRIGTHRRDAIRAALSDDYSDQYAAAIEPAAQLYTTLDADAARTDLFNTEHVERRYRALVKLSGMKDVAIAILKAEPHNQSHHSAAQLVDQHVRSMAKAIEADVTDALGGIAARNGH